MHTITRLVITLLSGIHRSERGQTLVLGVFAFVAIVGMAALAIDVGDSMGDKARAQGAADAAALKAADVLEEGGTTNAAILAAIDFAAQNGYDNSDQETQVTVNIPPLSGPNAGDPEYIEVIIDHDNEAHFAEVLGIQVFSVSARAVAGAEPTSVGIGVDASIVTLNDSACKSLEVGANGTFTSEGAIMINSDCGSFAAEFGCNDPCKALGGIESVGGVLTGASCDPCNVTTIPHFPDPLAGVLPPCFPNSPTPCQNVDPLTVRNGSAASPSTYSGDCTPCQPGIYYGGMDLGVNTGTLAPGVYIMAGGGFKLNSNGIFTANGVFIYNTEDPTCPSCGDGDFSGIILNTNDAASFSPMTEGPYKGLLMFQDRANTQKMVINNNSTIGQGTVYAPSAHIDFNPNDDADMQLIADTVKVNNNDAFTAALKTEVFYEPNGGGFLHLVE